MTKNATAPKNETSRAVLATAFISDIPPPDEPQHTDDDDEQHRQHEQRDRRAMRHVAGNDADLEALKAQHRSRADRTTIGEQEDDGKIGEGEHDAEDQADGHDRKDHGHDDLVVPAPEPRPVHGRRIDDVLRHRGDGGEEDYDLKRKKAPGVDDDNAENRQMRRAETVGRILPREDAERDHGPVNDAVE